MDLFNYIYYLPLMVTGPLMTYDQFEDNLRCDSADFRRDHPGLETPTHLRISLDKENLVVVAKFIFHLLRLMFWLGLSEVIVHRMYFGVLLKKPEFLRFVVTSQPFSLPMEGQVSSVFWSIGSFTIDLTSSIRILSSLATLLLSINLSVSASV